MEVIKTKTQVLKVIINCGSELDVNTIPAVMFLDNMKEVHTSHDEFSGDNGVLEVTHVLNVYSNVIDLESLVHRVIKLQTGVSAPQGFERGFFHYPDYCIRVYSETRTSFVPSEFIN